MALNSGAVPFFAPTKLYSRFDGSIISNSSSSLSPKSLSSFGKLVKVSFHTRQLPATVHVSSKLFSLLQQITKTRRHDECNEKLTSQIPFCRKLAAKMKAINVQFSCNAPSFFPRGKYVMHVTTSHQSYSIFPTFSHPTD